mgnify:CR=1 FL=1
MILYRMEGVEIPVTDSPLRYPGGKTQLKDFIFKLIHVNNINKFTYVEPFAGGAGIAISLILSGKAKKIIINDLDILIYNFWNAVINNTNEFIKKIKETPINIEQWHKLKKIQQNPSDYSSFDVGFSTFFLNRTNRSGIINGGPIGGYKQEGHYKLDCRFNKEKLINKILKIASLKDKIIITNYNALDFIDNTIYYLKQESTFIFFDPPYFKQGKELYANFFTFKDHVYLREKIKSLNKYYWIATYDLCKEISEIYSSEKNSLINLNYSVNQKKKAKELLFYSDKIILPTKNKIANL